MEAVILNFIHKLEAIYLKLQNKRFRNKLNNQSLKFGKHCILNSSNAEVKGNCSFENFCQIDINNALVELDKDIKFRNYVSFNIWGGSVNIGANVLFNNYSSINVGYSLKIGDNSWFGEGVRIYDHNHKFRDPKTLMRDQGFTFGEIVIGKNCWIGSNTVILKGVTIGDNAVIGANNIIYKSVPENTLIITNSTFLQKEIYDK